MPIYEFHCEKCNTIYKFFSRTVNTERIPNCPKCKTPKLKRVISLFSTSSGKKEEGDSGPDLPPIDEKKMERAMGMLEKEAGKINEDDPRQAASLMRKLFDAAGAPMGTGMEEALRRLEAGEDPDKIEQEMGDLLGGEDLFDMGAKEKRRQPSPKPKSDETLYDL
ncbi:zinc ribbon domain-containing protein [Candidatus Poribacteria bacterium]|nr:zinc ribbon domain-containing protein [Candidatus Poribacteria bacterium]